MNPVLHSIDEATRLHHQVAAAVNVLGVERLPDEVCNGTRDGLACMAKDALARLQHHLKVLADAARKTTGAARPPPSLDSFDADFIERVVEFVRDRDRIGTRDIIQGSGVGEVRCPRQHQRVCAVMTLLGWSRHRPRINGKDGHIVWCRPGRG